MRAFRFLILLTSIFLAGCVLAPPPLEEYAFAKVALESAKAVESARHSPGYFHQADESYRKAIKYFEDKDYELARKEFLHCRMAAEKAENSARLIRMKNGEVL
jgi:hypothetical protein